MLVKFHFKCIAIKKKKGALVSIEICNHNRHSSPHMHIKWLKTNWSVTCWIYLGKRKILMHFLSFLGTELSWVFDDSNDSDNDYDAIIIMLVIMPITMMIMIMMKIIHKLMIIMIIIMTMMMMMMKMMIMMMMMMMMMIMMMMIKFQALSCFFSCWRYRWRHKCVTHNLHNYSSPHIYPHIIANVAQQLFLNHIVRKNSMTDTQAHKQTNKHTQWKHYHLAIVGDYQQ